MDLFGHAELHRAEVVLTRRTVEESRTAAATVNPAVGWCHEAGTVLLGGST